MKYDVRIAAKAKREITENHSWLKLQSLASANRWLDRIDQALAVLASDPGRFPEAPEAAELDRDVRQMIVGPKRHAFRILFVIEGRTVTVQRARHASQNVLGSEEY